MIRYVQVNKQSVLRRHKKEHSLNFTGKCKIIGSQQGPMESSSGMVKQTSLPAESLRVRSQLSEKYGFPKVTFIFSCVSENFDPIIIAGTRARPHRVMGAAKRLEKDGLSPRHQAFGSRFLWLRFL